MSSLRVPSSFVLALVLGLGACRSTAPAPTTSASPAPGSSSPVETANAAPERAASVEPIPEPPAPKPRVVTVITPETAKPAATEASSTETPSAAHEPREHSSHGANPTASTPDAKKRPVAAELPNRDKHGNADVAKYIDGLQRPERVADLRVDVVLEKLSLPSDAVVGDLGCGPGIFATAFARQCNEGVVYASDVEPRQLDVVREKIRATNLRNIVPVLASEDDPHFPPATLDIVFVADTYHHLENRVDYMRRLGAALKPGGRLVVLEYKPGQLPVGPPASHKPAAGVMARELTEAGWVLVETFETHPYQDFEVWRRLQPWEKR